MISNPLRILLAWLVLAATPAPARRTVPPPARAAAVASAARPVGPGAATLDLRSDIDRLIASPGWHGDTWSVTVYSLERGDTLVEHQSDQPLAPASNMKLFTVSAALYYLGSSYRYTTYVLSSGTVQNGVLDGDLVLYGTGDPTMSGRYYPSQTTVLDAFADSLAALGIRQVRGAVVGDASYFSGPATGEGWETSYANASYAVPASALSLNENLMSVRVTPAATVGEPPTVEAVPGGPDADIVNQATTVAGGRTSLRIARDGYGGPVIVAGRIGRGARPLTRVVPAADPARYTAAVFRQVLAEHGIAVTGGIRAVHTAAESPVTGRAVFAPAFHQGPPLHVLTVHQSPPLGDILSTLIKLSHNMFAEQTLRTVGRVALGDGSVKSGYQAIENMLHCETGAQPFVLQMHDGSGLSPLNRTDSRTIVRLLSLVAVHPTLYDSLHSFMPAAGERHLRRMYHTPAWGNLHAKTGTIDHVSALSGYVTAADGEHLVFSMISNGDPSTWKAKRIEDAIGARLASFSRPAGEVANQPSAGRLADRFPASPPSGPAAAPPAPAPLPGAQAPPALAAAPRGSTSVAAPAPAGSTTAQPAPAPPTPNATAPAEPRTDTVQAGETLTSIADANHTTVDALEKANPGLNPRRLLPGKVLQLPGVGEEAASASGTAAAPSPAAPSAGARRYTIRKGDTLSGIADRFHTTVSALEKANPGLSPRRLLPGKRIRIP